jgi:hypothetical protein
MIGPICTIIGILLLVANVGLACWNISLELYWLLPINAVGVIGGMASTFFGLRIWSDL